MSTAHFWGGTSRRLLCLGAAGGAEAMTSPHSTGMVIVSLTLSAIGAACARSPAAPSGTDAVTVIGVNVPNGGTIPSGRYYVVSPSLLA